MASGGSDNTPSQHANRLIKEKSLYLQQHAHNPVDWFPWGQEAFDKAVREMKPIFLSVGYSTCHWCHVMERESFENEEIGQILNENFVSVKVDREERPDVDKVYMTFLQATGNGGGWPMSVWLTPDLRPFVGGTYFPPHDGVRRVGFRTVLLRIAKQWKQNRTSLCERSEGILDALQRSCDTQRAGEPPPFLQVQDRCFKQLEHMYDEEYGGFSEFPKFPTPVNLSFLFCFWALKKGAPEAAQALHMALHTLKMMSYGGIHDHIGKGFHRYSTDQTWHVPHFEKMLYDQAQLAVSYAEAFQISGNALFADVARDILQYVSEHLSDGDGGFYSAEDADSLPKKEAQEKKEGAFATWHADEIRHLLPDIEASVGKTWADIFIQHYGVREEGNVSSSQDVHGELTGRNVLIVRSSLEFTAAKFHLAPEQVQSILSTCRERLYHARKLRPAPLLDNKIVAAWNGLMISGFALCGVILGDFEYVKRAEHAASFLHGHMYDTDTGTLWRSCYWSGPESSSNLVPGFLDDYAFVIRGMLDLYEASLDPKHLEWAVQLQHKQDNLFWDQTGFGYFSTDDSDPSIVLRLKDDQDGAEPSGNSVSVGNLLRLSCYTGLERWAQQSGHILAAFSERLEKVPAALPEMVRGAMIYHKTIKQVLILADGDHSSFLYHQLPFMSTLERKDGKATAYVCEGMALLPASLLPR
ncbi:spermatogenesis-associated protein 20 isoform X2 [Bombina bombina]|uniref:spermatogenesis-associated protein 20 isoform X2 n=1 Tax=Bombina bombina TaxID=8345 RepID=UPI00235AD5F7|nr:spermatogenesis-associated protein 20 isoform X2 [Bombina bombina]